MLDIEKIRRDFPLLHENLRVFEAARQFPGRLKCTRLSWETINQFMEMLAEFAE